MSGLEAFPDYNSTAFYHQNLTLHPNYESDSESHSVCNSDVGSILSYNESVNSDTGFDNGFGRDVEFEQLTNAYCSDSDEESDEYALAETIMEDDIVHMSQDSVEYDSFTPSFTSQFFNVSESTDAENTEWAANVYGETAVDLMGSFGMQLSPYRNMYDTVPRFYYATGHNSVHTFEMEE